MRRFVLSMRECHLESAIDWQRCRASGCRQPGRRSDSRCALDASTQGCRTSERVGFARNDGTGKKIWCVGMTWRACAGASYSVRPTDTIDIRVTPRCLLSSSRRGQAHECNEKRKRNRQSDVHRQPPRPSARRQDLEEDRGRDHHHTLYSCEATATFAGGSGVKVGVFTLGHVEDFWSSTWVGSVAMLGNIEDGTKPIERFYEV